MRLCIWPPKCGEGPREAQAGIPGSSDSKRLGFWVKGSGLRVKGSGSRVKGSGSRVEGSGVWGFGRLGFKGLGFYTNSIGLRSRV